MFKQSPVLSKVAESRPPMRVNHGQSKHPLFPTWKRMVGRCYSAATSHFSYYGGRGIRVAERWLDFRNFLADMETSYFRGASIDRIDPNGHYVPENCRWATADMQAENRRNTRFIDVDGTRISLASQARKSGLHPETIAIRMKAGESANTAASRPPTTSPLPRRILIGNQEYPSLSSAAAALGVTRSAIFGRLKRGTARYCDE